MKRKLKVIYSIFAVVLVAAVVAKGFHIPKGTKKNRSHHSHQNKTEEKQFVIIVPSYNNSSFCERNLQSILTQNYKNYRIIYIDDCSTDDTYTKVKNIFEKKQPSVPFQIIHNKTNRGAMANLYFAIHSCKNEEIIVTVDGDDFLAHENVLNRLNRAYSNPNVWMTYGNFLDYPSYTQKPVQCKKMQRKVIQNNSFRSNEWVSSHLRTFYAGLFKKIRLQDMTIDGNFLKMGWDFSFMMPMLEMCGKHALFIKDVLYLYNRRNPISDHRVDLNQQQSCANYIRKLPKYSRLKKLSFEDDKEQHRKADLFVFSFDRPMQLYAFFESLFKNVKNLNQVYLIYRASNASYLEAYEEVRSNFPDVRFLLESERENEDFKSLLMANLFSKQPSASEYALFAVDDIIVKDKFDLADCIRALEKTSAYGFFLSNGKNLNSCYMLDCKQKLPPSIELDQHLHAWQFKEGEADWKYPNSLDMVLYKKSDIERDFLKISFHNPNSLEHHWNLRGKLNRFGLYFTDSKCVNIPLNLVNISTNRNLNKYSSAQLLEKFKHGLKMDIEPIQRMANCSRHIDYDPVFVERPATAKIAHVLP